MKFSIFFLRSYLIELLNLYIFKSNAEPLLRGAIKKFCNQAININMIIMLILIIAHILSFFNIFSCCVNAFFNFSSELLCTKIDFSVFDSQSEDVSNLHLNGGDVGWVDKLKYLGIYIFKNRFFKIDTSWVIRKFY